MSIKGYMNDASELKNRSKALFCLDIELDTVLHTEIHNVASNIKCKLIGIKHNQYLISSIPDIIDSGFIEKNNLKPGAIISCRYMHEGSVYDFNSFLMSMFTIPVKILIIQYPKNIAECNRRRFKRTRFALPSRIKFETYDYCGSIIDLSEEGCQMAMLKSNIGDNIKIIKSLLQMDISLMLKLPGAENEIIIPVSCRNIRDEIKKISIGLEFKNVNLETDEVIKRFVNEMRNYLSE